MQRMNEIEERIYVRSENVDKISIVLLDGSLLGLEMMMQMILREIVTRVWLIFMTAQYFGTIWMDSV